MKPSLITKSDNILTNVKYYCIFHVCVSSGAGKTHTVMNVSVPLLLHGNLKAAVQNLVERVDPVLHLCFAI